MNNKEGINALSIKKYWKDLKPPDITQLKKEKKKFYDETFPPNKNTLISKNKDGEFVDKYRGRENLIDFEEGDPGFADRLKWKRVTDISPKWELFEGKIEFDDVKQGYLGDCYFLSSIAALTGYPYLIKEKFRTLQFNEEGYYEVVFFIDGEWQILFLDDYFPYDPRKRTFAFARPHNNELWAMLLEKAWAKLNGGYSNIIGGYVGEPVAALTGFPTENLIHPYLEEEDLFEKIEEGYKEGTIMSSASNWSEEIEKRGIVTLHAYTLIKAKKWAERNLYLIRLRNPWGEKEWKGKWSDKSPYWTDEYKKYFGYKKADDGIFWIDISDYVKNFFVTSICYILYGAIVKHFYFEYQSYFKNPIVFNMRVRQMSKMSVSVLFKCWRFNREIKDLSHPLSLIVCKYDDCRNIEKLWGTWSCEFDMNIIEFFEPGYYVIWLYLASKGDNDPNFRYTVQVSSLEDFDIEFLGLDHGFQLIQYLLLENYKKTGANNLASSKDYFIGADRDLSKAGIYNYLIYNKTGGEIEIKATLKNKLNVQLLPPYKGLKNLKINLPPYENIAIVAIKLSDDDTDFKYKFKPPMSHDSKNCDPDGWKQSNGDEFADLLKFNINNNNPETMGLRTGEYKYVGKNLLQSMPEFDATQFNGETILQMTTQFDLNYLLKNYPKEMELLLKKFPVNKKEKDKRWDMVKNKDGKYLGQININNGNLDGKGVFIWNNGIKYIGNWKKGSMDGEGTLYDKDNKLIFEGNYIYNKKNGKGRFIYKDNEYYEGEFLDDKMEGKGIYYYQNGDKWEGYFKNNMKNGVGIMTSHNGKDVFLYEFENDNYMRSIQLNSQEIESVKNLLQEEKKKLLDKKKNLELVKVTQINQEVEATDKEKKHKKFLENIELYKKEESFMMEKFLELRPLNYEEDLQLVHRDKKKYLGGAVKKGQSNVKQGRGVYYDGKYYYAGYWDNNGPNGFFYTYNKDKVINFKGFLLKDYKIDPSKIGTVYFRNGDRYEGYFYNNKKHGFGTYYFSTGNSFTGFFNNGQMNGTGKYFYDNGLISEIITYQDNKIVSKSQQIREDYRDPNSYNFISQIKSDYPGVMEHILEIFPLRDVKGELYWVKHVYNNNDIYIGQMDSEKQFHGRCCIIYANSRIKYFVGYMKNKEFFGEGAYYDYQWNKIYEGAFEHSKKNGFGVLWREDGSTYAGEFIDDQPNGKGVLYYPNDSRFEGNFVNGYPNDKGFLISGDNLTKQEIVYNNGNIIEQGEKTDYRKGSCRKKFREEFFVFEKICQEHGYEKYMNWMMSIKPTKDSYMLKRGIKEEVSGIYIGEMNTVGFKYGRGVFIDSHTNMFYVGYFVNNEKFGKGINFYPNGKEQYIGEFRRNKPVGKGEFRYQNGEVLQGTFNVVGEGRGVYTFDDGAYWRGSFYAWTLTGIGTYYTKDGYCLGQKAYEYNKPI